MQTEERKLKSTIAAGYLVIVAAQCPERSKWGAIGCAVCPTGAPGCLQAGGDVGAPHLNGGTHDSRLLDKKRDNPEEWGLGKAPDDSCQGEPSAPVSQSRKKGSAASETGSPRWVGAFNSVPGSWRQPVSHYFSVAAETGTSKSRQMWLPNFKGIMGTES